MGGMAHDKGLRTMEVRLAAHQAAAMEVAKIPGGPSKGTKGELPRLPSHPQYDLMKQQQTGNTGLMSFEIHGTTEDAIKVAESLKIFKIGVSWGGFESLVFLPHARLMRRHAGYWGQVRMLSASTAD